MMYSLEGEGIDMRLRETRTAEFVLTDTFSFWVPPQKMLQESVDKFLYKGVWDASANSPTLADNTGTEGWVYKVDTAGGTDLDETTTAWVVGDYLMYGSVNYQLALAWERGIDSRRFNGGIAAMLAVRMSEEFGSNLSESMVFEAKKAREQMYSVYQKPKTQKLYDTGLVYSPTWARFNTDEAL